MRRKGREEGPFLRSGGRWEKDHWRAVETHAEVVFCGASYEKSQMILLMIQAVMLTGSTSAVRPRRIEISKVDSQTARQESRRKFHLVKRG